MRKLLLLSAAALIAGAANAQVSAPTLTQDWTYTTDLPNGSYVRWAVGLDGTMYGLDGTNKKLVGWNATETFEIGVGYAAWCLTADEAGNLLIETGKWGTGSGSWAILPADKISKDATSSDVVDLGTMTGPSTGRMDLVGRAIGDVMSATGGALYVLGQSTTSIAKYFIANGVQNTEKTVTISLPTKSDGTAYGVNNQSIVQPINSDVEATDNVVWSIRSNANNLYKLDGTYYKDYALQSDGTVSGIAGGDIITLNGITFTIEPSGTNYTNGFVLVDRTNDILIYSKEGETSLTSGITQAYVGFEKVNETTANVYHYAPGVEATKYTFEIPENYNDYVTAIETVEVDANAPVEYYNLQGVKVANPESGLFIKKQGSKTTKVVL